jgi:two-component system, LytTR family, sensor kinase
MFSPAFWRKFYFFALPLAIVLTIRNALMDFYFQLAPTLRITFEYNTIVWCLWLLIAPCLIRLFPRIIALPKRYRWPILALLPLVTGFLHMLIHHYLYGSRFRFIQIAWGELYVTLMLFACYAIKFQNDRLQAEQESSELEARIQQVELANIRNRLDPESIYQTLRSAAKRIDQDPEEADLQLSRLGEHLRSLLRHSLDYLKDSMPRKDKQSSENLLNPRLVQWAALLWIILGSLMVLASCFDKWFVYSIAVNWKYALQTWLSWVACALLSPAIFWVNRNYPLSPFRIRHAAVHLGFAFCFFFCPISFSLNVFLLGHENFFARLPTILWGGLMMGFKFDIYGAILVLAILVERYKKKANESLRAARLKSALFHAELDALRMQLHPHFLFNALNSIIELLHENPERAKSLLLRLEQFLAMTLSAGQEQQISLRRELDFVECYLEMQKVRFPKRLSIRVDIDPATPDSHVPALLLQPLVENAVRHGVARSMEAGEIRIRSESKGKVLRLSVENTCPASGRESEVSKGIGLTNTRKRLEHLYGAQYTMAMQRLSSGDMSVTIDLPIS